MTTQELYKAVHRRPFIPFTVKMADGSRYRVPGPEWILYPKPKRLVALFDENDGNQLLDLLTMTAIEYDEIPPDNEAEPEQETAA